MSAAKPENGRARGRGAAGGARRASRGGAAPAPRRGALPVALGGVAVALAAAFHVWTGLRVADLGYERSQAIALTQRLETQRQELADRLESLKRTDRLEEEAEERLGLGLPTAGQVVDLRTTQLAAVSEGAEP